jgi:hypothetical protein
MNTGISLAFLLPRLSKTAGRLVPLLLAIGWNDADLAIRRQSGTYVVQEAVHPVSSSIGRSSLPGFAGQSILRAFERAVPRSSCMRGAASAAS